MSCTRDSVVRSRRVARLLGCVWLLACGCGEPADRVQIAADAPRQDQVSADELDRLRALGYVDVVEDAGHGARGVRVRDASRMQPGETYFTNASGCSSHLIDDSGTVVRSWHHEPCERWDNSVLLGDGGVLAAHRAPAETADGPVQRSILRFAWDGGLLSQVAVPVHHDLELTPDGLVAAMTHEHRLIPEFHPSAPVRDHGITLLTLDGKVVERVSLVDVLRSAPGFRFQTVKPKQREGLLQIDLLHSNSVEFVRRKELAALSPLYAPGNVLVSIRHQDAVILFDWRRRQLVWSWGPGELRGPHDATLLENGNILVFDNRLGEKWSRVVEVDPRRNEIVWEYRAPVPTDFYTPTRGAAQRLANGNTLITDSAHGRIFEITRAGEIVWDYHNPFRDDQGRPLVIVRARRVQRVGDPGEPRFAWSD